MLTKDVMTRIVRIAREDWTLRELKSFLLEHGISGAPVVDATGRLVGVVSSTDLLRSEAEAEHGTESEQSREPGFFSASLERPLAPEELEGFHIETESTKRVADVMTPVVFEVDAETDLAEVADTMVRGGIHRVIVTRAGAVIGIVTALDVVRAYRDLARA